MATSTSPTADAGVTTWTIDASHSSVEFAVKHLMITTVKGRFGEVRGTVRVDEANPANSVVEAEIDTTSIDTRNEQRDAHLKSADFFDVANFPTISFRSKRIEGDPTGDFKLVGDLTVRGTTREITLNATFDGRNRDPWGGERASYSATGKLNRKEFNLNWNVALETGGWLVADDVKLTIDAQLVKQA